MLTVAFSDVKLSKTAMILSGTGATVALFCRFIWKIVQNLRDTYFVPEAVITYLLVVASGYMAIIFDRIISEKDRSLLMAVEAAEKAKEQAENANRVKSDFLANMSHEIRTPINAILGMNEMILREETNKDIYEYSSNIHMAANTLLTIVNDVLDFSKIESGKMEIVPTEYELGSLINDSYNMKAERLEKKGLLATVYCEENLPQILFGDAVRIRQIFTNLLTNAVKYTEKGSIEISVTGSKDRDTLILILKVKDTGIGILPENMDKLFGKFQRFDTDRNHEIEGTGLGLCITGQLVKLMNGEISVESTYGKGSVSL